MRVIYMKCNKWARGVVSVSASACSLVEILSRSRAGNILFVVTSRQDDSLLCNKVTQLGACFFEMKWQKCEADL
jgi:hypothetical protein